MAQHLPCSNALQIVASTIGEQVVLFLEIEDWRKNLHLHPRDTAQWLWDS